MDYTISIRSGGVLAGSEEPGFFAESLDMDVAPTLCQGSFSTIRHMAQIRTRNDTPNRPRRQNSPLELPVNPVTRLGPNRPFHHTHLQQVAECMHVDMVGVAGC